MITVIHEQKSEISLDPWKITVWDAFNGSRKHQWNTTNNTRDLRWAADNRRVAAVGGGQSVDGGNLAHAGWVYIFDTETGKTIHKLQHGSERETATAVAWDPTGSRIVSGNAMGLICIWDAVNGKQIANEVVYQSWITSLAWSPDQKRIASAAGAGQIKILDAETAEELMSLNDGNSAVTQLSWSLDGRKLSGLNQDGNIVVWDASRGYEYEGSKDYQDGKLYEKLTKSNEYLVQNKLDAALSLINEFLSVENESLNGLAVRAQIYRCLNQDELELADWTEIVKRDPKEESAWNDKGVNEFNLGNLEEALKSFTNAIDLGAQSVRYINRATAYTRQAKVELAAADFKKAAELDPKDQFSRTNLGRCQIQLGLAPEAIETLTTAIAINPESATDSRAIRATAYIVDGQTETGIYELETLFKEKQSDLANLFLSIAYLSTGKFESYVSECKELLHLVEVN